VIGVLPPRDQQDRIATIEPTEVATFRSDGEYSDGRRPDSVHFGNAKEDALRRDFTINGLFYDPESHEVIDYVQGRKDIDNKVLRTIGDPLDRFGEDKLRMLRAVRFATTLDFEIDADTLDAIRAHADDIAVVSGERIGAEMRRVLTNTNAAQGIDRLMQCNLDTTVLPEIGGTDRSQFANLIDHAARVDFPLSLACLMLVTENHDEALRNIAGRWKLSNEEVRKAGAALKHWQIIAEANRRPWSVVQPVLTGRDVGTIVRLAAAVIAADSGDDRGLTIAQDALKLSAAELNPPPLISGNDLAELGIPTGPQFGPILQALRDAQLNQQITCREDAARMAAELAGGSEDADRN
jgi:tRNA nucleotidyltransferase (CCA-adding enzyme)